jgi:uncharacterized protein YfkK (UPF0435 family)
MGRKGYNDENDNRPPSYNENDNTHEKRNDIGKKKLEMVETGLHDSENIDTKEKVIYVYIYKYV